MDSKGFTPAPRSEDTITPRGYATSFNNFYEFGTNARNRLGLSTKILRIVSSGTPA